MSMTGFQFRLLMSAVLIGLLLSVQARADTVFTRADADQLVSLDDKLSAAVSDLKDSFDQTAPNDPAVQCLSVMMTATYEALTGLHFSWAFLTLAARMRDKRDEHYVLDMLSDRLNFVAEQLPGWRRVVNDSMSWCSKSVTVNVKGQTVINIFSEIQQGIAPVSDKVQKALR